MVDIDEARFTETDPAVRDLWKKILPVLCEFLGNAESPKSHADLIVIPTKSISVLESAK